MLSKIIAATLVSFATAAPHENGVYKFKDATEASKSLFDLVNEARLHPKDFIPRLKTMPQSPGVVETEHFLATKTPKLWKYRWDSNLAAAARDYVNRLEAHASCRGHMCGGGPIDRIRKYIPGGVGRRMLEDVGNGRDA